MAKGTAQNGGSGELVLKLPQGPTLLEKIRKRPPIYLGNNSITTLNSTLLGYRYALQMYGIKNDTTLGLPDDFHAWVAYRLHFLETTMGWTKMILRRCNEDETKGLARFYELLDEHSARKGRVIAKLTGIKIPYTRTTGEITTNEHYPTSVSLVAYTDDPGFFVYSDEPGNPYPNCPFCPKLSGLVRHQEPSKGCFTVLDRETFEHWLVVERLRWKI